MEQTQSKTSNKPPKSDAENSWDQFSLTYFELINRCTLSLMNSLIALSRTNYKYKILDAGCGPGLGTKLIANFIPNSDSTIYALDFSEEMINLANKVFHENDDFNANTNNHWEVVEYPEYDTEKISEFSTDSISSKKVSIDEDLTHIRQKKTGKVIKFLKGNAESLIFADEQFDAYISNLCIMLCADPDKAIKEMYRVLKPGATAAISVWGKREDTKIAFVLFEEVFKKHGITPPPGSRSPFDLGKDPEKLKRKFLDAGFKDVRMQYMNVILDCFNEEDYMMKFQSPQIKALCKGVKDDMKVKEMLEEVKDRAEEELKKGVIPVLNCMVVYAIK